jgi:suppressor of fused-like protein
MGFLRRLRGGHQHDPESLAQAGGWQAIASAVSEIYGDEKPQHWGTIRRWRDGGPDPLDGIDAFAAEGPPRHWHFVTYGLSELYSKESDDLEMSGWGIELTFRLARGRFDQAPPKWPFSFLQNLARYVFETGNVLAPLHHLDLNGPIALETETGIRAVAFTEDPELPHIHTPNGGLQFVQVVGITIDELRTTMEWDTRGLLGLLARRDALLVTDLARSSILADPSLAAAAKEGIERDGSSLAGVNTDRLSWTEDGGNLHITLGAMTISRLHALLHGRTRLGRPFFVNGQGRSLEVMPADDCRWSVDSDEPSHLTITLTPEAADSLRNAIRPEAGEYRVSHLPGITFIVEPTFVRDQSGKVIEQQG